MRVKYVIARLERANNMIKHLPVLEFNSYEEAKTALNKVNSNHYTLIPMIIE